MLQNSEIVLIITVSTSSEAVLFHKQAKTAPSIKHHYLVQAN